jgi:NAD(P)-dependent dehydrogenase (short-subunit alcohol dehydrogenase family)
VRRLARESLAALDGRVHILVNNAGQPRVAPSNMLTKILAIEWAAARRPRELS